MRNTVFFRVLIVLLIYMGIQFFGGEWGRKIMHPINLLVTFLHELGHAVGALITGGEVQQIQINQDGSGFTVTAGGHRPTILMGGYLGSAVFGNILFLAGSREGFSKTPVMIFLALSMGFAAIYWYTSMFSTVFLILFSIVLFYILLKTRWSGEVLMFLGLACVLFIIKDFNVGPSSDLDKYADIMGFLPKEFWMYMWLGIALIITFINLRFVFEPRIKELSSKNQVE